MNAYQSWPSRVDYDRNGTIASSETNHPLSLAYDAARGFLHERETSQSRSLIYRHDALGRLSQVAERIDGVESELVRYGYSADGRLGYRKQASPVEELYLVSDGDQVVIERTSSAVQRTSVWASATLLKTRAVGGLELHLHQDRLGSVVLATQAGASGAELPRRVQFDPYGRRVSSGAWEGPGGDAPGTGDPDPGESSGTTPEQSFLADSIARAATAEGSIKEVAKEISPEDRPALAGKNILVRYGADDDTSSLQEDGGVPARAKAFAEVEQHASRLTSILRAVGANAESGPSPAQATPSQRVLRDHFSIIQVQVAQSRSARDHCTKWSVRHTWVSRSVDGSRSLRRRGSSPRGGPNEQILSARLGGLGSALSRSCN